MNKSQLDTYQIMLNKNGYLPKGQAQRLIDTLRATLPVESTEKPQDEPKPPKRRKTQA